MDLFTTIDVYNYRALLATQYNRSSPSMLFDTYPSISSAYQILKIIGESVRLVASKTHSELAKNKVI